MSDLRIQCTACGIALKISSTTTAKKIKCGGCGFVMPLVKPAPVEVIPEIEAALLEDTSSPVAKSQAASKRKTRGVAENCASPRPEETDELEAELANDSVGSNERNRQR